MKKILLLTVLGLSMIQLKIKAQTPTWSENIACIFYTNCTSCHHPGGSGPFSLLDYSTAYTSRYQIKDAVINRYMPPWPADPTYQTYAHERFLTQQEIDVIVSWVDGGAPEGDPLLAPPTPTYSATGSQLAQIDFSGIIGNYVNTATLDDYRCFIIPTNFASDTYISNIEIIPGNRAMVHHVLLFSDTAGTLLNTLDANDPGLGYTNFGGSGSSSSKLIGAYVPGSSPLEFPTGMGVKIPANGYLVLQMHYPQGTNGQTDSTRVNLTFSGGAVREVNLDPILNHGTNITPFPLAIPPNTVSTFTETFTLPSLSPFVDNYTLLSVAPHMHKVGVDIICYAIKPGNDTVPLINIPNWDFRWQGQYLFRQPKVFPEGTILKAVATFDNTTNNPFAPNPNNWVFVGEDTDDEMMLVYFGWLYALPGDENIVVDTTTVKPYWNNCFFMMNLSEDENEMMAANINLYPNPSHDQITISYYQSSTGPFILKIMDLSGRTVYEVYQENLEEGNYNYVINGNILTSGTYLARIETNNATYTQKFIVIK